MASTTMDKFGKQYKIADKLFLEKQKDLLRLFKLILQPTFYEDQAKIAKTYHIEDHLDLYTNKVAVKEFLLLWKEGFLPRGELCSIFYESHRKQYIALFKILYHAKDWDTFYKTACWAREHVNQGFFIYAMHVAVLHRPDTQGMVLPPLYELYPHFFVNSEVIDEAYKYKMKYDVTQKSVEVKPHIIQANYSGWHVNTNPIHKDLAYFMEDIGLNSYYASYHFDYPFWLGGEEFGLDKDRRGELFYYVHQQILARYYMERLSNNYGSIPVFTWHKAIKSGFVPSMRHINGLEFPIRPAYAELMYNPHNEPFTFTGEDNMFKIQEIEDFERRIRDAIDLGFIYTDDGTKINLYDTKGFDLLGKIIESNPDSPNTRFYGCLLVLAHQVLGYSSHPVHEYKIVPSVMEYFATALHDPMFYQFYKRIIYYFLKYKSHLPNYTWNELYYPGIKIENVTVDRLVTFFDQFEFDITNALHFTKEEFEKDNFSVVAQKHRLNHKPFTYKINVGCDKKADVVVRVFFGPKYDEQGHLIPIEENRINFVEMDKFVYTLQTGKNVIERNCYQGQTVKDRTTYQTLYKHVIAALKGEKEFHLDMSEAHNGFPNRFMLPKGKVEGQEFQFFVFISPYKPVAVKQTYDPVISAGIGSGGRYVDNLPFGYPLDRQIDCEKIFFVPNSYMQDVLVYHNIDEEMNFTHM